MVFAFSAAENMSRTDAMEEKQVGLRRVRLMSAGKDKENETSHFAEMLFIRGLLPDADAMRIIAQRKALRNSEEAFVVFNLTTVVERFHEWNRELPRVKPFYAIKCNNDPLLARLLAALGAGFDCASTAEMEATVGAGLVGPEEIIYANTVKQRSFIQEAERYGVRKMTFDSVEELHKIKAEHSSPLLVLRIRVDKTKALSNLGKKFGCDPPLEKGAELLQCAKAMGLPVIGISFHVGTVCVDSGAYERAIWLSAQLFDVGLALGHRMQLLDMGGGFPGADTHMTRFEQIAAVVNSSLEQYFPEDKYEGLEVIAEPGRFFGQPPVSLVANVIGATRVPASRVTNKMEDAEKDGYMYFLNDGSHGSFYALYNLPFKGEPLQLGLRDTDSARLYPSIIWGPTCSEADVLEEETYLPKLNVGDWIYYSKMGAYTMSCASSFNGFKAPERYYIVDENTWKILNAVEG